MVCASIVRDSSAAQAVHIVLLHGEALKLHAIPCGIFAPKIVMLPI